MARVTRYWLAVLLAVMAIRYRRNYAGRHRTDVPRKHVTQTYHPDHHGLFSIVDCRYRFAELWLARFDDRDESESLSAALMRAPISKHTEPETAAVVWDFSALWTVMDYLKAQRMSDWGWLKYDTNDYPQLWKRELELKNGRALATV